MTQSTSRLHLLVPSWLRPWIRRLLRRPIYTGDYRSWEVAQRRSRGYGDRAILDKTIAAARAVRDGQAAWERDTVLFSEHKANLSLLRSLQHVAQAEASKLSVLDFGGALGSTWWQHKPWLEKFEVRWSVVEQAALVAAGRAEFTRPPLTFHQSMEEAFQSGKSDVILLSSVLPYIADPHSLLDQIATYPFRYMIIDRTGFVSRGRDRLTVQTVPPSIYEATYPCWFFDRSKLVDRLLRDWCILDEWVTDDQVDIPAEHRGLFLQRLRNR